MQKILMRLWKNEDWGFCTFDPMQSSFYLTINGLHLWTKSIQHTEDSHLPTLIFLHEGLGSIEMWKDFPDLICEATGLNGILYDRQGHGHSDTFSEKRDLYYMHKEAWEVLPGVLQSLNIQRPLLIGHSDGGTIALLYASKFSHTQAIITEAAHVKVEEITLTGIREAMDQFAQSKRKALLARYHPNKTDALLEAWAGTWLSEAFRSWNIEAHLPHIHCPSLIIQGEEDPYATQAHVDAIIQGIGSNAEAYLVPHCGHIPHHQTREIIVAKMTDFILPQIIASNS